MSLPPESSKSKGKGKGKERKKEDDSIQGDATSSQQPPSPRLTNLRARYSPLAPEEPIGFEAQQAILEYPTAFSAYLNLCANTDMLLRLINSVDLSTEDLVYHAERTTLYSAAFEIFLPALCTATAALRALDKTPRTGPTAKIRMHLFLTLNTAIQKAYRIGGLLHIDSAASRFLVETDGAGIALVPRGTPMIEVFLDTYHAYSELKHAGMAMAMLLETGLPENAGEWTKDMAKALKKAEKRVWEARAKQLVHATVVAQFEDMAGKFFEDKDAWRQPMAYFREIDKTFQQMLKPLSDKVEPLLSR